MTKTPMYLAPHDGYTSLSPGGCVAMSFRGESRGILNLQAVSHKRFLASLEMTNMAYEMTNMAYEMTKKYKSK